MKEYFFLIAGGIIAGIFENLDEAVKSSENLRKTVISDMSIIKLKAEKIV